MWKGCGYKRRCISKEDNLMYVPILDILQCLLKNEAVLFGWGLKLNYCKIKYCLD